MYFWKIHLLNTPWSWSGPFFCQRCEPNRSPVSCNINTAWTKIHIPKQDFTIRYFQSIHFWKILSKYKLQKVTFKVYTLEIYFQSILFRTILSEHTLQKNSFKAYISDSERHFQSINFRNYFKSIHFKEILSIYTLQKDTFKNTFPKTLSSNMTLYENTLKK